MIRGVRARLKNALVGGLGAITGRHVVLLPSEARSAAAILEVIAPYRVELPRLAIELGARGPGRLDAVLLGYEGHFPTRLLWRSDAGDYHGPCRLDCDLRTGLVRLADREWGRVPLPLPSRRFCWRLTLSGTDGITRRRVTGHYLAVADRPVDGDYFHGSNYVDHEEQTRGDHDEIVLLLRRRQVRGPVLDVGCATGGLLAALQASGMSSVGIDASPWAVQRAVQRLGADRAWVCDVERDPLPAGVVHRGPFGALVLAAVLEHFQDPTAVLEKLTKFAATDALLIITTTNADGLTRTMFGSEWEGHFDWTHRSVDQVGARMLRRELPKLGWTIVELTTHGVWNLDADPTRATLRDWYAADARFRRLLVERELGDLMTCVAVKT